MSPSSSKSASRERSIFTVMAGILMLVDSGLSAGLGKEDLSKGEESGSQNLVFSSLQTTLDGVKERREISYWIDQDFANVRNLCVDCAASIAVRTANRLYKMLQDVAAKNLPADEKLMTFIYTRLDAIKALVFRNGTLRANFFRDIWRVEKVRKSFDIRETELIKGILDAGVREGIFAMPDTGITAVVLHHALKGLEVPYIRGIMGDNIGQRIKRRDNVMNLIFNGIKIK